MLTAWAYDGNEDDAATDLMAITMPRMRQRRCTAEEEDAKVDHRTIRTRGNDGGFADEDYTSATTSFTAGTTTRTSSTTTRAASTMRTSSTATRPASTRIASKDEETGFDI
ncbi:hypothetical protein BDZ89DRAFT_58854 [Hymenopellis radicata]|nr:hypothetical protein BDZ89DRAFT_58854 [Hymenopellis radicata]